MKLYMVTVTRELAGSDGYCVDEDVYCAGVYSTFEQAEERRIEYEHADNCDEFAQIHELELDKDLYIPDFPASERLGLSGTGSHYDPGDEPEVILANTSYYE